MNHVMDNKYLDELEELTLLYPQGTHAVFIEENKTLEGAWTLDAVKLKELVYLARLGLWAKEHGISALKTVIGHEPLSGLEPRPATHALAELPKESK